MKTIREIAIKHQRQMSSVHPHAIIGTIEEAIEEYASQALAELKAENEELKRQLETYKAMTGEKIPDVQTVTSTDIEVKPTDEEIEYHSCNHPEQYRFTDKDGNLRCSSCHKVIKH